jgi:hypothetical protein
MERIVEQLAKDMENTPSLMRDTAHCFARSYRGTLKALRGERSPIEVVELCRAEDAISKVSRATVLAFERGQVYHMNSDNLLKLARLYARWEVEADAETLERVHEAKENRRLI